MRNTEARYFLTYCTVICICKLLSESMNPCHLYYVPYKKTKTLMISETGASLSEDGVLKFLDYVMVE